jgi:hypothetical protein
MVKIKSIVRTGRCNLRHTHVKADETKAIGERDGHINTSRARMCAASKAFNKYRTGSRGVASTPQATKKPCTGSRETSIQQATRKPRTGCHKRPLARTANKSRTNKSSANGFAKSPARSSTGQHKETSHADAITKGGYWWTCEIDGEAYRCWSPTL